MTIPPNPPVTFVYADWVASYPEMRFVSPAAGQAYFDRAELYCENTRFSQVWRVDYTGALLTKLLYLLTSHIAFLSSPRDANGFISSTGTQAPPGIVGRINSATEGSVSVGSDWQGSGSPSEAFFLQTPYGAQFWQATAQFRLGRFFPNPASVPIYGGFGGAFPFNRFGRFGVR